MDVCLTDHVALNLHIHHYEVCPVEAVGHNPAYESSCKHNGIWSFLVKEFSYRILVSEIKFPVATANKVVIPTALEVVPNR